MGIEIFQTADERLRVLHEHGILDTAPEQEYDDIVALAKLICETPVALLSFVEADRQWFKAGLGVDFRQTPINESVCTHAIGRDDLLIIPDLSQDARTLANPLVVDGPRIRFYAGMPLISAEGLTLGTLCVIDTVPRPQGLTETQAEALRALGRQATALLRARRALLEHGEEEERYRAIFDGLDTGFCILQMKFDGDTPVDYLFLDVNQAFASQTGLEDAKGRWVRTLVPNLEQHWFDLYGQVARTGEAMRFEQKADAMGRRFSVYAFPVGRPGQLLVGLLFTDITSRAESEYALRLGNERLQLALDAGAGVGAWDWNLATDNVIADRRFAEIYGVDPKVAAEGTGIKAFFGSIHPDDLPQVEALIDDAIRSRGLFTAEYRLLQADGTEKWVAARGRAVADEEGRVARFPGVSFDITERKRQEVRALALLELTDALRDANSVEEASRNAGALLAEILNVDRAGYGSVDLRAGTLTIASDRASSEADMRSLTGVHQIGALSEIIARLRSGDVVALEAAHGGSPSAFGATAELDIPVLRDGQLLGLLFAHSRTPRRWDKADIEFARQVADRTQQAVARLDAEAEQKLLNQELAHRLKNTLAMVQAIASQSLRKVEDRGAVEAFNSRLRALSMAHDLLLQESWASARILGTIEGVMSAHGGLDRFDLDGPDINLGPKAVLSLSMLLHELVTNATKYGALSLPTGKVSVIWKIASGAEPMLRLVWSEKGGPPASEPDKKGFGSRLIRTGLSGTGDTSLHYHPTGLVAEFAAPLKLVMEN